MNPKPDFEAPGVAKMKAPFPYFGGKSLIAADVWRLLGSVRNYVEPFAGSLAVMLNRPSPFAGVETVNDFSCHLVNAWRAIQHAPEALASLCIAPVAEVNTEAQHVALIAAEPGLRDRLGDPAYYDTTLASWWIKGANEWIGSGWCAAEGPWQWAAESGWQSNAGKGVNRKLPHLGDAGTGAYAQRVAAVAGWLCALRDRLCSVRIACGDWARVTGESVTVKHGLTGVFLDPPYASTEYVYGKTENISGEVGKWCAENGANPLLRIVLAGRDDEHDHLLALGWEKHVWSGNTGYSKTEDRHAEALWCNPNCQPLERERDLFDAPAKP